MTINGHYSYQSLHFWFSKCGISFLFWATLLYRGYGVSGFLVQWLISYSIAGSDLIYHLNLKHNEYQDVKLLLWEKNSLSLLIMKYVKAITWSMVIKIYIKLMSGAEKIQKFFNKYNSKYQKLICICSCFIFFFFAISD